jgi:ABC-2 type transport system ATP-binding protein
MEAQIKINNLSKKYPNGTQALQGVNLDIAKGEFFTLLGPNGAGKSTLVKIMTTLIAKDSGVFMIKGINPEENFAAIQHVIGVATQENDLDPTEKVEHLLAFQGRLFGMSKKIASQRAAELLEIFDLEKERDKLAGTLSGGNKRRLHCALALVHHPRILFLDEPTVGMDPMARSHFWKAISNLNSTQGVTVFLTTQYLEEADKHASQMALLLEGKIMYSGSINNFKKKVHSGTAISLEDSYLKFINSSKTHLHLKEEVL